MKRLKKTWIWIAVIAVVAGGAFWFATRGGKEPEFITDVVQRGELIQTVEATGELESIDEVNLSFDTSGIVGDVLFDEGDVVVAGDRIAMLEAGDLRADVERAEQAVRVAEAALNLERAGSTSEAIRIAQANVDIADASYDAALSALASAEVSLQTTTAVTQDDIDEARVALDAANDALDNVLVQNVQDIASAQSDLVSTMKSSMISIRSALSEADEILGVDNALPNDAYENILGHTDPSKVSQAEASYGRATDARDAAELAVFVLSAVSSKESILDAADLVEDAFFHTEETLLYTRQVLDATVLETQDFTFADNAAFKASIDVAREDVQAQETSFVAGKLALTQAEISSTTSEVNARNEVASASQALASAQSAQLDRIADAQAALADAQANVAIREADFVKAEAQLAEVEAGPRGVDVAGLAAEVERAQADLEAAEARLSKAEIVSPIDGVVTRIDVNVGEQISAAQVVVTVQTTTQDQFRIVADIPEADVAKVSVGDAVDVTFDAYGDDRHFVGEVGNIDPAEKLIEGVVFYEVEIYLASQDDGFRPGLSADVTIQTESLPDTLFVVQRAILERDGEKYVRIPSGRTFEERVIETGIRGDDGLTQILSGIEEGEEIIVTIVE